MYDVDQDCWMFGVDISFFGLVFLLILLLLLCCIQAFFEFCNREGL